jgi:hypothetical protein
MTGCIECDFWKCWAVCFTLITIFCYIFVGFYLLHLGYVPGAACWFGVTWMFFFLLSPFWERAGVDER